MIDKKAKLEPDCTYHIYNRANGNERLLLSEENYRYFMDRYWHYVEPIAETFCYCLMPNHFHFLLRMRSEKEIEAFLRKEFPSSKTLQGFQTLEGLNKQSALSKFASQRFSHLFNGYAQAFNKVNGRKGSLFMHTFKRKKIQQEKYFLKLIHYIHYNPVEATIVRQPQDWRFSSYSSIISNKQSTLKRDEVLQYFGDLDNFIHCHKYPPKLTGMEDF